MNNYTSEQLKNLVSFIKASDGTGKENFTLRDYHWDMVMFLEATSFDPMTFEDWVEANEDYLPVFSVDTEDLPLLINEDNSLLAPIISWRLQNGC